MAVIPSECRHPVSNKWQLIVSNSSGLPLIFALSRWNCFFWNRAFSTRFGSIFLPRLVIRGGLTLSSILHMHERWKQKPFIICRLQNMNSVVINETVFVLEQRWRPWDDLNWNKAHLMWCCPRCLQWTIERGVMLFSSPAVCRITSRLLRTRPPCSPPPPPPWVSCIRVPLSSILTAERHPIASQSSPSPSPVSDNGAKLRQRAFLIPLFKKRRNSFREMHIWLLGIGHWELIFPVKFSINNFLPFLSFFL